MNENIKRRRQAAMTVKVAALWGTRLNIHDPEFNIREIAKQLALLEEHLFHPGKLCPDCVRKHLLTVEALADEATSLACSKETDEQIPRDVLNNDLWDKLGLKPQTAPDGSSYTTMPEIIRVVGRTLSEAAKRWVERFNSGERIEDIGEEIRQVRKNLVQCIPDPRRKLASAVIAAIHMERQTTCEHRKG